jgi:hypothetical protein
MSLMPAPGQTPSGYEPGPIPCEGCFTGEFGLGDGLPIDHAPYVIARDRIVEALAFHFNRKLLPLSMDRSTGNRFAGGYYLLPTAEEAAQLCRWYQDPVNGFILDGTPILQRSYFIDPVAHWWHVAGAEDFAPLDSAQHVVRFERWRGSTRDLEWRVMAVWPDVRQSALDQKLAAVWLLVNPAQEESVGIVSVASWPPDRDALEPGFKGIDHLSGLPGVGAAVDRLAGLDKSFDRTSWIFSVWFPYRDWRTSRKLLWPNSPPFPQL